MRIEELETPAVVVDLDVLERNLRSMSEYCREHNLQLRPHTKTHKIPEIARMQRAHGSQGITVAKPGEAEVMAGGGLDDILVHYPVYGDSKLDRLAVLARNAKITVAVDAVETAQAISRAAVRIGSNIRVLVEIDSGMHRCGVPGPEEALALAQAIQPLPGLELAGISTYPGHVWDKPPDQAPTLRPVAEMLETAVSRFSQAGLRCEIVSSGSTPAARNSHLMGPVTEVRPGTYVFNDRNTMGVEACDLADCALRVIVTVVSTAVKGRTIVDGGSKTFSSDRWYSGSGGHGYIVEHPEVEFVSMSEEHGHLDIAASSWSPRIGELLTVVPNHVCSCVNLHDTLFFHRAGVVEGQWSVAARGRVR